MGIYQEGHVFLGNRRLSIIDLKGGHQPMFNEDHSIAVVLNGEIYNYRELALDLEARGHVLRTSCDTEVLVHLFEEHGTGMCQQLRGMFSFAVWDSRNQVILLARDRFGKKPLYYNLSKQGLIFASELKALQVLNDEVNEPWQVSDQAVYDYLSLAVIPQPNTIFEEVYAVPAASRMLYDGRNKLPGNYDEILEQTREHVSESVRLRLRSDVPLAVFLSGGLDSSVVAYEASRQLGDTLQTFTVAMSDTNLDESATARRTAATLGVRNVVLPLTVNPVEELHEVVRLYDQPFADPSAIPTLKVSKLAAQHVKVILNGDGGDELFVGYRRYIAAHWASTFARIPRWALVHAQRLLAHPPHTRQSLRGFATRFLRGVAAQGGERYLIWTTDILRESDKEGVWLKGRLRPTETWIETLCDGSLDDLDTQIHLDMKVNLLSALLVKMDMATMAASLEARSPLMDHVVAEFSARIPDHYRLSRGRTKSILRDAYRGLLPDEVITRPKSGFDPPLFAWLHNDLKPITMDVLGGSSARVRSHVGSSFVNDLLSNRTPPDLNWALLVYALLILELWFRERESHRGAAG
jgi:asparagine synthase (glutamine-hydrolysing)